MERAALRQHVAKKRLFHKHFDGQIETGKSEKKNRFWYTTSARK